jgi:hypothetical protein
MPVVKVTITTFFLYTNLRHLKIIIKGQKFMERIHIPSSEG